MDERIKEKLINRAKTNPYVNFLGIDFTVIEEGRVEAHMPLHDEQRQYSGVTHGGVLAALADTIAGFAAYTMTPLEKDVLTAELKMSFLRAAWGNELIAKGTVIKAGRNIHFCECEIYCDPSQGIYGQSHERNSCRPQKRIRTERNDHPWCAHRLGSPLDAAFYRSVRTIVCIAGRQDKWQ